MPVTCSCYNKDYNTPEAEEDGVLRDAASLAERLRQGARQARQAAEAAERRAGSGAAAQRLRAAAGRDARLAVGALERLDAVVGAVLSGAAPLAELRAEAEAVERAAEDLLDAVPMPCPGGRAELLAAEASALRAVDDPLPALVAELRALEETFAFQAGLRRAARALAAERGWSERNFAYGSTPFHSWQAVHASPPVAAALASCRERGGRYVVFGSSLGWLVFYAALAAGVRAAGYEILPFLAAAAADAAGRHGVAAERAELVEADMMSAPLADAGVVMLASQCWDEPLREAVAAKLRSELAPGSVVVDYTPRVGELLTAGSPPAATVSAPVSWNADQTFYIYEVPP